MPLKLNRVTPKGGTPLGLGQLTVLVGPNNAGKSQTLRDLRDFIITGSTNRLTILEQIEAELPTQIDATREVTQRSHANPGLAQILGVASDLQSRGESIVPEKWVDQQYAQIDKEFARNTLLEHMGKFWCGFLDAETRFRLAASTDSYDTRIESPTNALQAFFSRRSESVTALRRAFTDTFGMDIALDWAAMKRWYLRVGRAFGTIPDTLDGLDATLADAQDLSQQGDGYRSFTGVLLALLAFPDRVIMLDEPEAFLHPAQARALGRYIAGLSKTRVAQVIVASHSSAFLLGIISGAADATVIRLNRTTKGTSFHQVPSVTSSGLINSPLLSSQPVLDALFHKGVVVCEGDPDRALYQTILHQFLRTIGGEEILLIHSNGKDAAKVPIEMLRSAGTPVCAIVDIDILNSAKTLDDIVVALSGQTIPPKIAKLRERISTIVGEAAETDLLNSLKEAVNKWQQIEHTDFRQARKTLAASAGSKSQWGAVKSKGLEFFVGANRQAVEDVIELLAELRLFIVPCGELEGWFSLGLPKGAKWNRAALEQLHTGNCPPELEKFMRGILNALQVQ